MLLAEFKFNKYDDIFAECIRIAHQVDLFLIATGPCAGVLAFDLSQKGFQAIDVGHIDLEYEWFLAGKGYRVPVPHKYNNELSGGDDVASISDPKYFSQIIKSFD